MEFERDRRFYSGRLKSLKFAVVGAYKLLTSEHSVMSQFFIAAVMTILGFVFEISVTEWMFQVLAIGLVLSIEGLNTAVEKLCDFVHPQFDARIGFIKDIAAGAVFFAALTAIAIGMIIYLPKILQ
ncbi:MAG TPA: diacylglycerol kinase family protein [Flavobacterium sp.]|nr:diacylglycerol kinase family protein [Flavobacterium sp.]